MPKLDPKIGERYLWNNSATIRIKPYVNGSYLCEVVKVINTIFHVKVLKILVPTTNAGYTINLGDINLITLNNPCFEYRIGQNAVDESGSSD